MNKLKFKCLNDSAIILIAMIDFSRIKNVPCTQAHSEELPI